jgi:hypothetical protein
MVGLDKHFDYGDEVEKEGHSTQMHTCFPPAEDAIKHGWEDGNTRRRVEDSRNS